MVEIFTKVGLPVEYFPDVQSMRTRLFQLAQPQDVVLIKGRNTAKLWQILESL
jgi:UDP-N-acetylmuramyl pentapeptide synthase